MKSGEEYTYGKHYKIMVYRVTMTNVDGVVHEFSPREVQIWCKQHNLTPVVEYYYGKAMDLYPELTPLALTISDSISSLVKYIKSFPNSFSTYNILFL